MTDDRDWMVLAGLCDCNGVAISVLEPGVWDRNNIEPDTNEAIRIGADWRPLVIEAASELHRQHPDHPIMPRCTVTYAAAGDRARQDALDIEVSEAMYDAFPPKGRK